jgi:hypothetical protein
MSTTYIPQSHPLPVVPLMTDDDLTAHYLALTEFLFRQRLDAQRHEAIQRIWNLRDEVAALGFAVMEGVDGSLVVARRRAA